MAILFTELSAPYTLSPRMPSVSSLGYVACSYHTASPLTPFLRGGSLPPYQPAFSSFPPATAYLPCNPPTSPAKHQKIPNGQTRQNSHRSLAAGTSIAAIIPLFISSCCLARSCAAAASSGEGPPPPPPPPLGSDEEEGGWEGRNPGGSWKFDIG